MLLGKILDALDNSLVHYRVAHDAAFTHLITLSFELRLNQGDDTPIRLHPAKHFGQNECQRDKRHIDHRQIDWLG